MDICIQFMRVDGGGRYAGDIVGVDDATVGSIRTLDSYEPIEPIGSKRTSFLHVIDIPTSNVKKVISKLTESNDGIRQIVEDVKIEPSGIRDEIYVIDVADWSFDLTSLDADDLDKVHSQKYLTITFSQMIKTVKSKKLVRGVKIEDFD